MGAQTGRRFLHPSESARAEDRTARAGSLLRRLRRAQQAGASSPAKAWVAASWLFLVEPLSDRRCRFISRYRVAYPGIATRLAFGPTLLEPIGFAMDRRMLLGVKARSEHGRHDSDR